MSRFSTQEKPMNTYTMLYVHLKRTVAAQRHMPTKGKENERINLKEDNYGTILFYIFDE